MEGRNGAAKHSRRDSLTLIVDQRLGFGNPFIDNLKNKISVFWPLTLAQLTADKDVSALLFPGT